MEDKNAEKNKDIGFQRTMQIVRRLARGHSCNILASYVASFCLFTENLSQFELREMGCLSK